MLMQRLITSLILIPCVMGALFYAPGWILLLVLILILLVAGKESWQLVPLTNQSMQYGFLVVLLSCLWLCGQLFTYWLYLGLAVWLFVCIAVLTFPNSEKYWGRLSMVALMMAILLPLFLQSLIHLYAFAQGKALILYLFCLVWAADIGAYLAGKRWGLHKLIPQVSPGKSWEGALGGLLLVLIVALIGFFYFNPIEWTAWFFLALWINVISIFGDLFISILKRRCSIKDTGSIIPGHGGILDRLDSSIAAMPFFYMGITYLDYFTIP